MECAEAFYFFLIECSVSPKFVKFSLKLRFQVIGYSFHILSSFYIVFLKAQPGSGLFLHFLNFLQRKLCGSCHLCFRKAH